MKNNTTFKIVVTLINIFLLHGVGIFTISHEIEIKSLVLRVIYPLHHKRIGNINIFMLGLIYCEEIYTRKAK